MPRRSSVELDAETFRRLGHRAVDRLADLLASLPSRPVTSGHDAAYLRDALGQRPAPDDGADPEELLDEITAFLIDHSLYNGHPRFMGYITSSPAPLGSLADLVAATVNPNCGSFSLSPVATVIEQQAVAWKRASKCSAGTCVEVALASSVLVRDAKDPDGPSLSFSATSWTAFVQAIKCGAFAN